MQLSILLPLLLTAFILANEAKPCRYWCRTKDHRYYCCPEGSDKATEMKEAEKETEKDHHISWPSIVLPIIWYGFNGLHFGTPKWMNSWKPKEMTPKKMKKCPPLRAFCPRSADWFDPPLFCNEDDWCKENEKCCYDVCLDHKVCKIAE